MVKNFVLLLSSVAMAEKRGFCVCECVNVSLEFPFHHKNNPCVKSVLNGQTKRERERHLLQCNSCTNDTGLLSSLREKRKRKKE